MIATLKSELLKLATIRSTYVAAGIGLLFIAFMSFYVEGMRGTSFLVGSDALRGLVQNMTGVVAPISGIIAVMIATHEYRFNIITYTLTSSNSRTKVLLSKIITATVYIVSFFLLALAVSFVAVYAGLAVRGVTVPSQTFSVVEIFAKPMFYILGYGLVGLLFGFLLKNVAAAISVLFIAPNLEPLVGILLKDNSVYLPFSSLQKVLSPQASFVQGEISPLRAAMVFGIYFIVAWVITWLLFLRRDAN